MFTARAERDDGRGGGRGRVGREGEIGEWVGVGHPQHMLDSGCCRKMVLYFRYRPIADVRKIISINASPNWVIVQVNLSVRER
jgi:hypothetical protein